MKYLEEYFKQKDLDSCLKVYEDDLIVSGDGVFIKFREPQEISGFNSYRGQLTMTILGFKFRAICEFNYHKQNTSQAAFNILNVETEKLSLSELRQRYKNNNLIMPDDKILKFFGINSLELHTK